MIGVLHNDMRLIKYINARKLYGLVHRKMSTPNQLAELRHRRQVGSVSNYQTETPCSVEEEKVVK